MTRLSGEDVKERVEKRMATIDALPADLRAVVHDLGWNLVQTFMVHGITKPKTIRSLTNAVLHNTRSMDLADPETRDGCILAPREPTEDMVSAALRATNVWLNIPGTALTVNREKMRIRYRAMLAAIRS